MAEPSQPNDPPSVSRKVQIVVIAKSQFEYKALLLQTNRARGSFWQNVTGSVEDHKTFLEGALRELKEETGIKVDHLRPQGVQGDPYAKLLDLNKTFHFTDRWGKEVEEKAYLCFINGDLPNIILDKNEHETYRWVDLFFLEGAHYKYPSNYEALCFARKYVQN